MGRGLQKTAADRRDFSSRRRPRSHAAEISNGVIGKADRKPASLSPESGDVGRAARVQPGVDGRVPRDCEDGAGMADGSRLRPTMPVAFAEAARSLAAEEAESPLSGHYTQPPQPVRRA